jgi:hypothetical protein
MAIIILCSAPLLFLVLAIIRVIQGARFSNYQARIAQMMIFWITISLLLLIRPTAGMSDLIVFIPAIAYFITHYFNLSRKRTLSGITFVLFISTIIGLSYAAHFGQSTVSKYVNYSPLSVQKSKYDNLLNDQKVWVIGSDLHLYKNSTLASKYYNWETYGSQIINGVNDPFQIALVYQDLLSNSPDVIVDHHQVMQQYFIAMPDISNHYELLEQGLYLKKDFQLK